MSSIGIWIFALATLFALQSVNSGLKYEIETELGNKYLAKIKIGKTTTIKRGNGALSEHKKHNVVNLKSDSLGTTPEVHDVVNLKGDSLGTTTESGQDMDYYYKDYLEEPPTGDTGPSCFNPPCNKRKIITKFYVNDELWNQMDTNKCITNQVERSIFGINKHLARLDNGGYQIQFDRPVVKLSTSDVKMKEKYKDRQNFNKIKTFNSTNLYAHAHTFQQTVEEMKNRNAVDVRVLFIPQHSLDLAGDSTVAIAEENCICHYSGPGCIIILSVDHVQDWSHESTVFAHEFGHVLGALNHDDMYYNKYGTHRKLIMWSAVDLVANIWSPAAREQIVRHGNECLQTVEKSTDTEEQTVEESTIYNYYNYNYYNLFN